MVLRPDRHPEGPWTRAGVVVGVLGLVVAVVGVYIAYLTLVDEPTSGSAGGGSTASTSEPSRGGGAGLTVSPLPVDFGDELTITGTGLPPAEGLELRVYHGSISFPVWPDEVVVDANGRFTRTVSATNQGWCGTGTLAAVPASASGLEPPPPVSAALATARMSVSC